MISLQLTQNEIQHRNAMTAVEVVASTVLASLLMVAVLGVLRGLKAQEAALELHISRPAWHATLDEVLRQDLLTTREYQLLPSMLVLHGFGERDPQTQAATWRPAVIEYAVIELEGRSWLVRSLRSRSAKTIATELVATDVHSLRIGMGLTGDFDNSSGNNTDRRLPMQREMNLELFDASGELLYAYQFKKP